MSLLRPCQPATLVTGKQLPWLWGRNLTDEAYAVHGLYFGADARDVFAAYCQRYLAAIW